MTDWEFSAKRKFLDRFFLELPFELVYTPKMMDPNGFPEMRDTKDSPILATAIMEGIDVFVTGDKDFQDLTVADFSDLAQDCKTYDEFIEKMGHVPESTLQYFGVAICGAKKGQ